MSLRGRLPADPPVCGRAFSLLEMVVVIIIISIAAAMVIPMVSGSSAFEARAAARMLMADLEYAQNQAIVTQTSVTVTFDEAGNSYRVSNASGTLIHPITKAAYVVDFDTLPKMSNVSIYQALFAGTRKVVTFTELGAPDNAGYVTLVAGAHTYRVDVAAVTGRVTVTEL